MAPRIGMVLSLLLLASSHASAATLDVPRNNDFLSGIGVIHGWKCTAGQLTVRFNGGPPLPLLYEAQRDDVRRSGACSHANVGFVSIMNWGELGDGTHTAVVYDDGVAFARSHFRVVTPGVAFVETVAETCIVEDFPLSGDQSQFLWNESTQHMELVEVEEWYDEPDVPPLPANADLDFLLTTRGGRWTIEVPDVQHWKYVSEHEHPDYNGGFDNPDPTWPGGSRYVPAPADLTFLRYVHGATSGRVYPFSAIPPWGISLVGHIQGTVITGADQWGHPILRAALPNLIEVGTLANGLPFRTREAIGELGDGYSLVVPRSSPGTTQGNRCYILVFDDFHRPAAGGLETQARFYITARSPYIPKEPRLCVPPIYPGGSNSQPVAQLSRPGASTRVLIY